MNLEKLSIRGFRSIRDEQTLFVDPYITILIGANDHGKSNLLEAIRSLNDDYIFNQTDRNWDTPDGDAPYIEYTFSLNSDDKNNLINLYRSTLPESFESDSDESKDSSVSAEQRPSSEDTLLNFEALQKLEILMKLQSVTLVRSGLESSVKVVLPKLISDERSVNEYVLKNRPRVELFQPHGKVADFVDAASLDLPEYEFMQGIFRKAGIWEPRDTLFSINPRTRADSFWL